MVKKLNERIVSSMAVNDNDYAPIVVKVIAVIGYIMAVLGLIAGFVMLFGGRFLAGMIPWTQYNIPQSAQGVAGTMVVVISLLMIIFSIFWIFVSRGVWNYVNWARIVMIVFAVIGAINSIIILPAGIITLVIDAGIVYFLAFDKNVKSLFK